MVFSTVWVAAVARASTEACQSCNPERLTGDQVMELLCCLPLHHLRRLAICIFSFFCFPVLPDDRHRAYYAARLSSSSDDSSSLEDTDDGYDSHSD